MTTFRSNREKLKLWFFGVASGIDAGWVPKTYSMILCNSEFKLGFNSSVYERKTRRWSKCPKPQKNVLWHEKSDDLQIFIKPSLNSSENKMVKIFETFGSLYLANGYSYLLQPKILLYIKMCRDENSWTFLLYLPLDVAEIRKFEKYSFHIFIRLEWSQT